ncbi:MAG: homocysteine S-methyltransferase family protein, partial [Eggerthellaceae bacterium]|nr:homocysteine S-methyltransferase family protein [Eggerthellaceae bacterium]
MDRRYKDENLKRAFEGEAFLLQDGATGTMLQARGLFQEGRLPDLLTLENPQAITDIHRAFVDAGAQAVSTDTFNSNALKLAGKASVEEVFDAAVRCARASGARYIAADIGPAGELLAPWGDLSFNQAYGLFAEQVRAADRAGVDLFVIATMSDILEMKAAVLAARENSDLPVIATMTFNRGGRSFLGVSPIAAALMLESLGVAALGINCSLGPADMVPIVQEMAAVTSTPLCVRPNAGLPHMEGGKAVYDVTPRDYVEALGSIVASGASIIGGCCGMDPAFIEAAARFLEGKAPVRRERPAASRISAASAQRGVFFESEEEALRALQPVFDPCHDPGLCQQAMAGDFRGVIDNAIDLAGDGAQLLGVCLG